MGGGEIGGAQCGPNVFRFMISTKTNAVDAYPLTTLRGSPNRGCTICVLVIRKNTRKIDMILWRRSRFAYVQPLDATVHPPAMCCGRSAAHVIGKDGVEPASSHVDVER